MKTYTCKNGHEFDLPETQGEEWSETDVCPICKTDEFDLSEHEQSGTNRPNRSNKSI